MASLSELNTDKVERPPDVQETVHFASTPKELYSSHGRPHKDHENFRAAPNEIMPRCDSFVGAIIAFPARLGIAGLQNHACALERKPPNGGYPAQHGLRSITTTTPPPPTPLLATSELQCE